MPKRNPSPTWLAPTPTAAVFGAAGMGLILYLTHPYGAGVSADSVQYFEVARSLLRGDGFTEPSGHPMVNHPPLLSMVLAMLAAVGVPPPTGARIVNAAAFGGTVAIGTGWLMTHLRSRPLALVGAFALLFAVPLAYVAAWAWTEPLFILFLLLTLKDLEAFRDGNSLAVLGRAATWAALAFLTRYAGLVVVGVGALLILARPAPFRSRLKRTILFSLVAAVPAALWLTRNHLLTGTWTGPRPPSVSGFAENAHTAVNTVFGWLWRVEWWTRPASALVLLCVGTLLAHAALSHRSSRGRPDADRDPWPRLVPHLVFAAAYGGFIVVSASTVAFDRLSERFIAPLFPATLFTLAVTLDHAALLLRRVPRGTAGHAVLAVLAGAWVLANSVPATLAVPGRLEGSGNYASDTWRHSEIVSHLQSAPPQGVIYSNLPEAVFLFTGRRARLSPRLHLYRSTLPATGEIEALERTAGEEEVYLVWFLLRDRPNLQPLDALRSRLALVPVAERPDGKVYRVLGAAPGP